MSKIHTLFHTLRQNRRTIWLAIINKLQAHNLINWISDEKFLRLYYWCIFNKKLNLNNPKTFNEKLQWLKLNDRKPEYHKLVDKYEVKQYVAKKIGEKYIIPTYGVWDNTKDIDWQSLPEKFVVKTTGGSGGNDVIICNNKTSLDISQAIKKLNSSLSKDAYWFGREECYHNNVNRVIAEALLEGSNGTVPEDYKLLCFNGKVKCSFICTNRFQKGGLKVTFYDRDWNIMPFERSHSREQVPKPKPENYETMVELAELLSANIPFVRVDFYDIEGHIYFGELTFYPGSGFEPFQPDEWDIKLGAWLNI